MTRSEASRINGTKSAGPKTPEGKLRSSQNAFRHGLTAKTMATSGEDGGEFELLLNDYLSHYQPEGPVESALVRELAGIQWRQIRLAGYETGMLQKRIDKDHDEVQMKWGDEIPDHERGAIAFDGLVVLSNSLAVLVRYDASLRRGFHRVLDTLATLQKSRQSGEQSPENTPAKNVKLRNEPKKPHARRTRKTPAKHKPLRAENRPKIRSRQPARMS